MREARSTQAEQRMRVSKQAAYRALLDADALVRWLPPEGMTGTMHAFEPGRRFRMSLTYADPSAGPDGKTSAGTDTFDARIIHLVPDQEVGWRVAFESDQEEMSGDMDVIWRLATADDHTLVTCICRGIPLGIRLEDNEAGCASSLQKLAAYIEGDKP